MSGESTSATTLLTIAMKRAITNSSIFELLDAGVSENILLLHYRTYF